MNYFAAGFFAAGFLVVVAFLAGVFAVDVFAAGAFAAGALAVVVFGAAPILTPEALASLATAALRREAVFFLRRPFLTALSYSDWTAAAPAAVGAFLKSLRAVLMDFLISTLIAVRLTAWRAAFFADLIIGIEFFLSWENYNFV